MAGIIEDLQGEEWMLVKELHNNYKISNYGRLSSINYNRTGNEKILKLSISKGYHRTAVSVNTVKKNISIHRLVAKYFIPNPNNLPEVNHKDGVPTNNYFENLEWCTKEYNKLHAIENNLFSHTGEEHHGATINNTQVIIIKQKIAEGKTTKQISKETHISQYVISHIRNNRTWTHIIL